ncbi:hypothetical protein C9374_000345 [Naegleria lovaniensis]|uniref:EF-hand domain-containing protein n=1 Tax=Naegleria lovaniensis TaxID=51637 RepID=A0AA88GV07_NAELO|nr:uncharacterized protein C9374_000345 [Naegleria lovaniensis]KAG2388906.1 hypothetical protein C9374_000345 [Naegleria lovaniensis]
MSFTLPTERNVVYSYFQKFDKDSSGHINLKELNDLLLDLGFKVEVVSDDNVKQWRDPKKREVIAIANLIDKDHSKSICFDEFYTWWIKLSGDGFSKLTKRVKVLTNAFEAFQKFDTDKSGFLDFPDEFNKFYDEMLADENVSKEEVMKSLDRDGDGKITFQELVISLGILNN